MSGKASQPSQIIKRSQLVDKGVYAELLSRRELEVLGFLNTHLTVEEISQEMYVAASTVRTHVRNIYARLGVHNRIEALQKAGELTLI